MVVSEPALVTTADSSIHQTTADLGSNQRKSRCHSTRPDVHRRDALKSGYRRSADDVIPVIIQISALQVLAALLPEAKRHRRQTRRKSQGATDSFDICSKLLSFFEGKIS